MIGRRFGEWLVVAAAPIKQGARHWLCHCACGTEKIVRERHLIQGKSTCCQENCQRLKTASTTRAKRVSESGRLFYKTGLGQRHWADARQKQFETQKGICPICLKPLPSHTSAWCWDHNHKTDESRALVHRGCNVLIGWVERDFSVIERAKQYVENYDV